MGCEIKNDFFVEPLRFLVVQSKNAIYALHEVPDDKIPWLRKLNAKQPDEQQIYINSQIGKIVGIVRGKSKDHVEDVVVRDCRWCGEKTVQLRERSADTCAISNCWVLFASRTDVPTLQKLWFQELRKQRDVAALIWCTSL